MAIGGARWIAQIAAWVSSLIVIRFVTPDDYGIVGMAVLYLGLAMVVTEFGITTAIISLPEIAEEQIEELNTLALAIGIVGWLVSLGAAWPLGYFFRESRLPLAIVIMSTAMIWGALRSVPVGLLQRNLAYRSTASVDLIKALATTLVVLVLAVLGGGYWAFVIGNVTGSFVATLWVWNRYSQAYRRPSRASLAPALRICRHLIIGRVVWRAYSDLDFLVVGRFLGTATLGFYTLAWNLASLPGEKLTNVVSAATAPFFAAVRNDLTQFRRYFLGATEVIATAVWPVLFGFALVADLAVPIVFGPPWSPAVPLIRFLVVYAAIQSTTTLLPQILNVTEQSHVAMQASLFALAILAPSFFVGAKLGGAMGVAFAWSLTFPIVILPPLRATLKTLRLSFWKFLASYRMAFVGSAAMVIAVVVLRLELSSSYSTGVLLIACILTGAITYAATLWLGYRRRLRAIYAIIRGVRRSTGAEGP